MKFLIKSCVPRGTRVEIVENGKRVLKHVPGLGAASSEELTEDMKGQAQYGFIKYSVVPPPSLTDEELDLPELPVLYTDEELESMTKADLKVLIDKHELPVSKSLTKVSMLEELVKLDIPKE